METRRRILLPIDQNEKNEDSDIQAIDESKSSNNKTLLGKQYSYRISFLLIIICFFIVLNSRLSHSISYENLVANHAQPRHHSEYSNSNTNRPPKSLGNCHNLEYTVPSLTTKHKPIWIASYPGSGSEMVRDLVVALTGGLVGGSVYVKRDFPYKDCVSSAAATCKTHWPLLPIHSPLDAPAKYHDKSILLVRNPIQAFASRLNHLWEVKAKVQAHTQQAPEVYWNKWIQKNWKQQVMTYKQLIETWIIAPNSNSSFPYQVELVLAYEDLTTNTNTIREDDEINATVTSGVMAANRLVQVLHQANARVVLQDDDNTIACLWKHVVVDRPKMKRSDHDYIPGYTLNIQRKILDMLSSLLESLRQIQEPREVHNELIRFLEGYAKDIRLNTRIIK